jgi:hypothetical protein
MYSALWSELASARSKLKYLKIEISGVFGVDGRDRGVKMAQYDEETLRMAHLPPDSRHLQGQKTVKNPAQHSASGVRCFDHHRNYCG